MPVSSNNPIDFSAISAEMANVTSRWMNATVKIIDPNLENMSWNEWTNTMTGNPIELWEGPARVQHLSNNTGEPEVGMSVAGVRRVRIQVPLDDTRGFVRSGLEVRVVSGGEFADLQDIQFRVMSAINSSYAWLLTIECEADVKSGI